MFDYIKNKKKHEHKGEYTSGMAAFSPGIFKLGYDGGGPYRCIAISHGGGIRCFPFKAMSRCKNRTNKMCS